MTANTRDTLKKAVTGWAQRNNVPILDYRARHMNGCRFLGIETLDSAKTLYSIACYIEDESMWDIPIHIALFDDRFEDMLPNGRRVIYWPGIPAETEDAE